MTNSTGTDTITTIHFILIALLAVAAIAIIVVGVRLKGKRKAADDTIRDRAAEADAAPTPPPVAPSPPPVADTPVIATPEPERLQDEPIAAAAPLGASPAAEAAVTSSGPSPADGPLTQIKGLGPKLADRLAELGITTVGQIAALDEDEAQALDTRLGAFTGRLQRDRWVEQARFLAAGDRSGFEAVFGKL